MTVIFDKGGINIKWNKNHLFNKWYWENWTTACQKVELDHQLIPCTRINPKWINNLNISCVTIKILEENTGRKVSDISHNNIFGNISPRPKEIKEKINKWDYIKLKSFCMAKLTIIK